MLTDIDQFQIHGIGPGMQGGAVANGTVKFSSSGLVGTAYGFPGLGATRSASGIYNLTFPRSKQVQIQARPYSDSASGPVPFQASIGAVNALSGTAKLFTYLFSPTATASGAVQHVNPGTGTYVRLQFIDQPVTEY